MGEEYVDGTTGLKYVRFIGCIVLMAAIFSAYLHIILIGYKLKSVINGADRIMPISYESSGNDYAAARETFSTGMMGAKVDESDQGILVMSFNIRHGVDHTGKESLDSIIDEIKAYKPQIIALQEVDCRMPRSRFRNQAKIIADALGYNYIYGDTINFMGIKYGNTILSAYPIVEYKNIRLPSRSLEGRAILVSKINIGGEIYHVLNTHLGLDGKERNKQIGVINNILKEIDGNIILMGDFNEQADTLTAEEINRKMIDTAVETCNEYLNTYAYYSDIPNTRIDHIYVSQSIQVIDHFVIPSRVSDHSMVFSLILHKAGKKRGII
ncbi:MAG: hypothetical protein GX041_04900 [Clostridiales bacterium]|nr:hypothetical protein [Clostridiales bacterium]